MSSLFSDKNNERDLSFGLNARYSIPALIQQQQWQQVETIAHGLTSDELSRLVDGICLTDRYNKNIQLFIRSADTDFSHLVAGAWYLYQAWQARTGKWAEDLSKSEVEGFFHYLQLARLQLGGSFEQDAYRCEARARLVRTEMGLSEPDKAIKAFQQSIALDDSKFWAYHHVFKLVSPKWLGDKNELVAYIESVEKEDIQYALWLMYLVEMYSDIEEEENAPKRWYTEHSPLIQKILTQPKLPVDSSLVSVYANNNLAYLYHLLGEKEERNTILNQLVDRFPPYPWAYFGIESGSDAEMRKFRQSAAYRQP
ncbi:tetratricopeptide repeat protein [Hymenobacter luteus]